MTAPANSFSLAPLRVSADYMAMADMFERGEADQFLPEHINPEAARTSLHRRGLTIKPVRDLLGTTIGYRIERLKKERKQ